MAGHLGDGCAEVHEVAELPGCPVTCNPGQKFASRRDLTDMKDRGRNQGTASPLFCLRRVFVFSAYVSAKRLSER